MDWDKQNKKIGRQIKKYQKKLEVTPENFSQMSDITLKELIEIEKGNKELDFVLMCKLIRNAGIEPNFLFNVFNKRFKKYKSIDYTILELVKAQGLAVETDFREQLKNLI